MKKDPSLQGRASEHMLTVSAEKIIQSANIMIVCLDVDGKVIFFNETAEKITGYTKDEVLGRNWFELIVPHDHYPEVWKVFEEFKKKGKSIVGDFENPILTKDGKERIIQWRNSDLYDDGHSAGIISYGIDITDRQHVEKTLLESEERFRGMMEQSVLSIQIFAPDGRTVQVNHAFEMLWGVTFSDLTEYNILKDEQLVRLGIMPHIQGAFAGEVRSIPAAEYDTKETLGMGKKRWVQSHIYPVKDKENVIRQVILVHEDITERKQAEREIVRINRALRMISDINQALIHSTDEAMILQRTCDIAVGEGGYRLAWIGFAENDEKKSVRMAAFAGVDAEYIASTAITWADSERGHGPTGTAIRTGKTVANTDIGQDPLMDPWREAASKYGYKSSIAIPLKNKGQTFGALNIYATETDAFHSEELAIIEELAGDLAFGITTLRMRTEVDERTKELNQLKNKFVQIVSHQLRTPLNVIRWNLETLLEHGRGEITAAQEEILHGTYAACTEVTSRIGDLTTAMDIEEHRLLLDLNIIDGDDVIRSATIQALKASIFKQITNEIVLPKEPLPSIQADAGKIRDVITRLVDNAITYTENNGHITVSFFLKDGHIRFEITDTGIGIPASEQKHIFERFFRGSNASLMKTGASGLSLFICKSYIQAHHGTIGFLSTSENGSTFWFELPVT